MFHAFPIRVAVCLLLPMLCIPALAQPPADTEEDATATVTDATTDAAVDEEDDTSPDPDLTIPEVPETTVVGRPAPFPASPLGGDTVVSTTRTEAFASQEGASLTVITGEQIRNSREGRLSDVLRSVPGLDVARAGGVGQQTSVFLRGANSYHTKVMVDGIPLNDPSNPQRGFDFSLLSVDEVQQVEVLRGPQSTLWGSDAMGGVVNIVTKRGEGPTKASAGFSGGSFGTSRESVNISGGTSRYHYSLGGSYQLQDGFSAAAAGTENDGFSGATFAGRTGWTPTENFDIDYSFRYIDQLTDLDGFDFVSGPADNLFYRQRWQGFFNRIQARLATLDGCWEHRLAFNYADHDRKYIDPPPFFTPRFQGRTSKVEYLSLLQLTENNTLTAGVDYWDERATDTSLPEFGQNMFGIYVQDQIRINDHWFTNVGFRWDDHSRAGSADTYQITSRYNIDRTGTSFHGSIGTGFRAPSLTELFHPIFGGNPNLEAERSFGWDVGMEQRLLCGALVLDGTYFRNDFSNLIEWVPAGGFTGFYRNVGRVLTSGVEMSARLNFDDDTTLTGSYVYTLPRNQDTGQTLLRRPYHKAAVGINRRLACGRGNVGASLNYVGSRFDYDQFFTRTTLDEYYLVKVTGSYELRDWCELFVRVDNALDENYQEVWGYNTAPLSAFGGVNIRL